MAGSGYCIAMLRRIATAILLFIFILLSIPAAALEVDDSGLIVSDIPITYGDEGFRERILEKTKGERDPVGLVLTGGSARALAHIGVLQYLEENGIVPDFIISNSMGSIIGMLYAAGLTPSEIIELLLSADLSALFSFTLPISGGILLPSGFETLIDSVVGKDTRLEDLDIPVMVVCDDIVTKREIRITEGDFSSVMLASFALPVYFPPREYQGHLLIDGGVVTLLPLAAAFEYTDTVIVSTAFYNATDLNLLNAITILNASFDVGKNQKAAEAMKTHEGFVWIRCDVEGFSFMDFDKAELMARIGYESAVKAADELENIFRSGVPESLAGTRARLSGKIADIKQDLDSFGRVDASSPSSSLSFAFESNQGNEYRYYLSDIAKLALIYEFRTGGIETGVLVGGAFDFTTHAVADAYPLLDGFFRYYPVDRLRFTLDLSMTFCHDPWYIPHIYARQGFDWMITHSKDEYSLAFKEAFEYATGFRGNDAVAVSGVLDATFHTGLFDLYPSVGYLLTAENILFDSPHHYAEAAFDVRFWIPPAESWFIDAGVFSRISVDGRGGVPLFLSDGYASTLLGSGTGFTRLSDFHNTIMRLSAGYALPFSPTFGEFLIFEDLEVAAYCDILMHDMNFEYSAGIEAQTAFSMIGLMKLPFRVRLGYDSLADSFVSSFLLSLKY